MSDVSVYLSETNKPLREYRDEHGNVFVEGRKKSAFYLEINNRHTTNNRKVKAIISIDGLSVVDGKPASDKSSGYIIEPLSNIVVKGWRTGINTINEFFFDKMDNSYSKSMGYGKQNVGVIGVMFFREYDDHYSRGMGWINNSLNISNEPIWNGVPTVGTGLPIATNQVGTAVNAKADARKYVDYSAFGTNYTETQASGLGTGFGSEINSPSIKVGDIKFEETPFKIVTIYYDDRAGLEKRGIVLDRRSNLPNPFPQYQYDDGFAKYPPVKTTNYRG